MDALALTRRFEELFGKSPRLYRAPGRVNLIGEHTDYNDGFVMPAAIDRYCWIAIAPRLDRQLLLYSSNFAQSVSVHLEDSLARTGQWSDYVVGTAVTLLKSCYTISGADMLIHGEIPFGSGLSSSAAIEVATAFALCDIAGQSVDLTKLALTCQRAENEFVGAPCGIMDQYISANGQSGHALLLDCRSLQSQPLPIPDSVRLVVCNTGVKHSIAGGEYSQRRAQCEEAIRRLSSVMPGIRALRDVTTADLEKHKQLLPELIYRRARHVVTEDERTQQAAAAFKHGDLESVGQLMAASHRSLRDDYEVSCPELDVMVEIANAQPGVIGARMTGGGFGGCTVNLVKAETAQQFQKAVGAEYERRAGIHPEIYVFSAADGVSRVTAAS